MSSVLRSIEILKLSEPTQVLLNKLQKIQEEMGKVNKHKQNPKELLLQENFQTKQAYVDFLSFDTGWLKSLNNVPHSLIYRKIWMHWIYNEMLLKWIQMNWN